MINNGKSKKQEKALTNLDIASLTVARGVGMGFKSGLERALNEEKREHRTCLTCLVFTLAFLLPFRFAVTLDEAGAV